MVRQPKSTWMPSRRRKLIQPVARRISPRLRRILLRKMLLRRKRTSLTPWGVSLSSKGWFLIKNKRQKSRINLWIKLGQSTWPSSLWMRGRLGLGISQWRLRWSNRRFSIQRQLLTKVPCKGWIFCLGQQPKGIISRNSKNLQHNREKV